MASRQPSDVFRECPTPSGALKTAPLTRRKATAMNGSIEANVTTRRRLDIDTRAIFVAFVAAMPVFRSSLSAMLHTTSESYKRRVV
jgi:hypothetical protein